MESFVFESDIHQLFQKRSSFCLYVKVPIWFCNIVTIQPMYVVRFVWIWYVLTSNWLLVICVVIQKCVYYPNKISNTYTDLDVVEIKTHLLYIFTKCIQYKPAQLISRNKSYERKIRRNKFVLLVVIHWQRWLNTQTSFSTKVMDSAQSLCSMIR